MLKRVAKYVARVESNYEPDPGLLSKDKADTSTTWKDRIAEEWFETMEQGYWLPSSPFLMNAGTKVNMLSACFVCGLEDSMEGIFSTLGKAAIIQKTGGGTGFNFSKLRAEGATINSTGGTSSGPLSFMEIFNTMGNTVKQGGRRRSANMGILRIDHPDILKFIRYKSDMTKLTNFNVSVAVTDKFMTAVKNKEKFELIEPSTGKVVGEIDAYETFKEIAYRNWLSAEPGLLFIDTVNKANPTPHLGNIEATNPCGEIPLLPWEACNLASINVERFVKNGTIDWEGLDRIVRLVVRFLDDAIDVNELPLPEIEAAVRKTRKLGLGIMGLHGALIRAGIPYDTAEGREFASSIMAFVNAKGHEYSSRLGKERGNFPAWEGSCFGMSNMPMRNATITTIAPTGRLCPSYQ